MTYSLADGWGRARDGYGRRCSRKQDTCKQGKSAVISAVFLYPSRGSRRSIIHSFKQYSSDPGTYFISFFVQYCRYHNSPSWGRWAALRLARLCDSWSHTISVPISFATTPAQFPCSWFFFASGLPVVFPDLLSLPLQDRHWYLHLPEHSLKYFYPYLIENLILTMNHRSINMSPYRQ